jgi:metal-responsive CopG/Arc/MetJ family transcriptional regulator
MARNKVTKRKKPGPPPTGQTPVIGLRLKPEVAIQIDQWADKHGITNRSDAIRRMIDKALACTAANQAQG